MLAYTCCARTRPSLLKVVVVGVAAAETASHGKVRITTTQFPDVVGSDSYSAGVHLDRRMIKRLSVQKDSGVRTQRRPDHTYLSDREKRGGREFEGKLSIPSSTSP